MAGIGCKVVPTLYLRLKHQCPFLLGIGIDTYRSLNELRNLKYECLDGIFKLEGCLGSQRAITLKAKHNYMIYHGLIDFLTGSKDALVGDIVVIVHPLVDNALGPELNHTVAHRLDKFVVV